nr:MAG: replication initiator protein [Microvirus sp.]
MPCYKPLQALVRPGRNGSKSTVTFPKTLPKSDTARHGTPTPLPCGQCIGCRLERSRQWATRLMKERKLHDRSSFLTLTYDDAHLNLLPDGRSTLVLQDVQLFLKRLRRHFAPDPLRFFQCGEYGDKTDRPHHHMILFGEDFCKDRTPIEPSRSGFPQYVSPLLTKIWSKGRATISEVSFESAAYVARYCLKKVTGKGSQFFYKGRKPEFVTMSRNPGIAAAYFDEYFSDMYPSDEIIPDLGRPPSLPPKYFDKLLERVDPALHAYIKKKRTEGLDFYNDPNSTDTRLAVRERVKAAIIKNCLKRD